MKTRIRRLIRRLSSFARGGLRFTGRRRYLETALRVIILGLAGAAVAYAGYVGVGLLFDFLAYLAKMILVLLLLAATIAAGWVVLAVGSASVDAKIERSETERKVKLERAPAEAKDREDERQREIKLDRAHKRALERERELKAIRDSK